MLITCQGSGTALETLAAEASATIENARLYREATEKALMDGALRIASQIQQSLLPQARKNVGYCEAVGASSPCRAIGGDFFEYLDLPDGSFGFALGDVLTVFSDGVSEALSTSGEEFGEERIRTAIVAPRGDSTDSRLQTLLAAVRQFTQGAVQNDDVTALIIKYLA